MEEFISLLDHYRHLDKTALDFMIPIANSNPQALFSDVCADLYRQANESGDQDKMTQIMDVTKIVLTKKLYTVHNVVLTRLEALSNMYAMKRDL